MSQASNIEVVETVAPTRALSYGWVMVAVAAFAMVATLPGRTHGLGMITERLLADPAFGLTRVSYSDLNLWGTLLGGLFCLPCGWMIDRWGLRLTLTGTVLALAVVVLGMTRIDGYWPLFGAILLTRGFGQSALSIISISLVAKWFPTKSTLPMAVYSLILGLGFALAFQFAKPFEKDDWRVLWDAIGWLLAAFVPIAWCLTTDPPPSTAGAQDSPLLPGFGVSHQGITDEPGYTLVEALGTPAFWIFALSISVVALQGSGLTLFNESVLKEQGFSTDVYYNLGTYIGIVGLAAKLPVGWLGNRFALNRLLAVGLGFQAACLLWLPSIRQLPQVWVYGIGMGIGGTITTVLFFSVWGQAFGRPHLGKIMSLAQMMTVLASAAGPKFFAECHQRFGNYHVVFQSLAAVLLFLAACATFIRMPDPASRSSLAQPSNIVS